MELITPALATVTKFRAAGNDVVNASRKSCFRRNEETELANFFDRSHAAEQLRRLAFRAALISIGRRVDRLLRQRRVDISGRNGIDAHSVLSFINRQRFGERRDRAFGSNVRGGVQLSHRADQTRHVDDVALCPTQVWKRELASSKDADQIQIQQVAKIIYRKIVDRFVWRVPAGIIN